MGSRQTTHQATGHCPPPPGLYHFHSPLACGLFLLPQACARGAAAHTPPPAPWRSGAQTDPSQYAPGSTSGSRVIRPGECRLQDETAVPWGYPRLVQVVEWVWSLRARFCSLLETLAKGCSSLGFYLYKMRMNPAALGTIMNSVPSLVWQDSVAWTPEVLPSILEWQPCTRPRLVPAEVQPWATERLWTCQQ